MMVVWRSRIRLRAIEAGVCQVQGTINGIGERCGNVDLTTIIANLELKYGFRCLPEGRLQGLTRLSRKVWETLAVDGPLGQPYVGVPPLLTKAACMSRPFRGIPKPTSM